MIVEFLRDYFTEVKSIIYKHNGMLDKFMGDNVMALSCIPSESTATSRHAAYAIDAALAVRKGFDILSKQSIDRWHKAGYQQEIKLGIGCSINTGRVVFGRIGRDKNDQLTAIGSAVNLAKRLESLAQAHGILFREALSFTYPANTC